MKKHFLIFACALLLNGTHARAQTSCNPVYPDLTSVDESSVHRSRALELIGEAPLDLSLLRRSGNSRFAGSCGTAAAQPQEGLRILPANLNVHFNSGYPTDRNNGAMWWGRGFAPSVTAGVGYRRGIIDIAIRPIIGYEQNSDYTVVDTTLPGLSKWAFPWAGGRIDWPQRMGDEGFVVLDPADSYISVRSFGARAGVSTANFWWGPGTQNAILMTNTAPGMPHAFVGTDGPITTAIGDLQIEAVWGKLEESKYFDTIPTNDHRFFAGLAGAWSPKWVTGLQLGAARAFYKEWPDGGLGISDFVPFFEPVLKSHLSPDSAGGREDAADQLLSVFFRWSMPASGVGVYAEWARNDHAWDIADFIEEPNHSQGYLLGIEHTHPVGSRALNVNAELIHLQPPRGTPGRRAVPTFYLHYVVRQGYTNQGQVLGASVGAGGGDSQYLSTSLLSTHTDWKIFFERVRWYDDLFSQVIPIRFSYAAHDVQVTGGGAYTHRTGPFELSGGISWTSRGNRLFTYCNAMIPEDRNCSFSQFRDTNWEIPLSFTWRPH